MTRILTVALMLLASSPAQAHGMHPHWHGGSFVTGPVSIQQGVHDPFMDTPATAPEQSDDDGWAWVRDEHGAMVHVYSGPNK